MKKENRKGRSWLHKLTPDEQMEAFAIIEKHTYAESAKLLRDRFKPKENVWPTTLSEWRQDYILEERVRQRVRNESDFKVWIQTHHPDQFTSDQIMEMANKAFLKTTSMREDLKGYTAIVDRVLAKRDGETRANLGKENLAVKKGNLKISAAKLALLEKKSAQADALKKELETKKTEGGISEETRTLIERSLKLLA